MKMSRMQQGLGKYAQQYCELVQVWVLMQKMGGFIYCNWVAKMQNARKRHHYGKKSGDENYNPLTC